MNLRFSFRMLAAAAALLAVPAAAGVGPNGVIKGIQPVTDAGCEAFDVYAICINSLGTGPDDEYQALVTVKNKSNKDASLVASHIQIALINANNEPRTSDGNLYEPDAIGPRTTLPQIKDSIDLKPGEQARVKLTFWRSKGFAPKTVRIREYVNGESTVTYTVS